MKSKTKTIKGRSIPALGLGTWNMRGSECEKSVRRAIELGYRHIDTAAFYENEKSVGKAIDDFQRDELFITTKVWKDKLRYEDFKRSTEGSLNRLGTNYVDLLLIHWPNEEVPIRETMKAMKELVEEGKVRHIGVSNFSQDQLNRARETSSEPIVTNQVKYHVGMDRSSLLHYCRENGLFLTAYSPLGQGEVLNQAELSDIAVKYDKSPGQIALKWLIIQENVLAIPKASSESHLRENIQLFDWQLEEEDIDKLNHLVIESE
ncbi:MAG: aldo/keto reductase, partial [Candidatus Bipolaricaulota bacterium]